MSFVFLAIGKKIGILLNCYFFTRLYTLLFAHFSNIFKIKAGYIHLQFVIPGKADIQLFQGYDFVVLA